MRVRTWTRYAPVPSDFELASRQGYVPGFPTVSQWQIGGTVPANKDYGNGTYWDFGTANASPATVYTNDYQGYSFGFGYYGTGGC